ncbi:MAG: ATPase, T2SS/T4P/T4SS family, partial [Patescibacteria group bacterium]
MPVSHTAIINRILTTAFEYKASDLHFTAGNPPIVRVDGRLVSLTNEPIITSDYITEIVGMFLNDEQKDQLTKEREILVTFTSGTKTRFRVHIFYQRQTLAISLRMIANIIPTIEQLGLPKVVSEFTKSDKGLVIICGPFGSGRSATVAALINTINQTYVKHIITIEKPIEYLYVNAKSIIEQREVGRDTLSFEQALETSLKEDIDVLMVSELDNPKVIKGALDAAAASRLVFGSMDTP